MKTALFWLMVMFMLMTAFFAFKWHICSKQVCPEVSHVNEFIEAEDLEPISVQPVIDSKFDELFGTETYTHKKKPSLKERITNKHNYHKVKKGENLYRIGLQYGVSYKFLMAVNNFKSVDIESGQWIYLGTKEERLNFISKEAKIKADSLYIYNKRYMSKDSTGYADVYTESYGQILRQSVDLHMKAEIARKMRFGLGVQLNSSGLSPYEVRGGLMSKNTLYTAGVGVGQNTFISVGIMKFIK